MKKLYCIFAFVFFTANLNAQCPFNATLNAPNSSCESETIFLQVGITGGVPPFALTYSLGGFPVTQTISSSGVTNIPISPAHTVDYFLVSVIDDTGCSANLFGGGTINVTPIPNANPASLNACDEGGGMATFNLTSLNSIVNGGTGFFVDWFLNAAGTQNLFPESAFVTTSRTVYATVQQSTCESPTVPVSLIVESVPGVIATEINACDEDRDELATFNLTAVDNIINGGNNFPVNWYLDPNGIAPITNPQNFTSLTTSVYAIVIGDNCVSPSLTIPLIVNEPANPPIISGESMLCEGFVTILDAGSGYHTYHWSTGETTQIVTVDTPGIYSVTITNSGGCTASASLEVNQIPTIMPEIQGPTVLCTNEQGTLQVVNNFSDYIWSNGAVGPSITVFGPGISEVTVVDFNGCATSALFEIENTINLSCIQSHPDTGFMAANGIAEITFSGGTPPYFLNWTGTSSGNLMVNDAGSHLIPNLITGIYQLTIEDNTGCQAICDFEILGEVNNNISCDSAEELTLSSPVCQSPVIDHFELNNLGVPEGMTMPLFSGCNGDGFIDENAVTVWYTFSTSADSLQITIDNGLNTPNIILYEADTCLNLLPIACASGIPNSGYARLNVNITSFTSTYYIQIAGGEVTDQSTFDLEIESIDKCTPDDCTYVSQLNMQPTPTNGHFLPGQSVQFCYVLSVFNLTNVNWLHALEVNFGQSWDLNTFVPFPPSTCSPMNGGIWDWYPYWESCITNESFGPGFAFDSPNAQSCGGVGLDGDPGNNFGDGEHPCTVSGFPFEFCWNISVKDCLLENANNDLGVHMRILGDGVSGGYNVRGCIIDVDYFFQVSQTNSFLDLGPNLDLCEGETYTIDASAAACSGCSFSWSNGETTSTITVAESGTYSLTVTDPEGCIAEDDIHLTFHPPSNTSLSATSCEGESYFIGGQVFTQSGFYNLIFTSSIGCDSIVALELTVLPEILTNVTAQICDGEVFMVGTNSYDQPGQYLEVLVSAAGCDSIVELTLEVFPVYNTLFSETICNGQSIDFGGNTYTQSGIYEENFFSIMGCDSVVSLDLTVLDEVIHMIDTTILQGESIAVGNSTYDQEGIYYDTLFNASIFGCDSIIITNLSILITDCNSAGTIHFEAFNGQSNDVSPDTIFLCFGDTLRIGHNGDFDLNGDPNPATVPGIGYAFYDCLPAVTGPTLMDILADTCLNHTDPLIVNGNPVTQDNDLWITAGPDPDGDLAIANDGAIQTAFNSGIAMPTQLWLAPITLDDFAALAFEADGGSEPGPCVSVSTVEAFSVVWLNEIEISNLETDAEGCGASFQIRGGLPEWDGSNYSVSITKADDPDVLAEITSIPTSHEGLLTFTVPLAGSYIILVEDGKSCPAEMNIEISLHEVTLSIQNEISCFGGTDGAIEVSVSVDGISIDDLSNFEFLWGHGLVNQTIAESLSAGQYSVTVTNALGCSAASNILVDEPDLSETEITASICDGESFLFGTVDYDIPGIYTETFVTDEGCDSLVTLILDVLPLPGVQISASDMHICVGESVILTASGGVAYLWSNGETSEEITVSPTLSSTFTVTVVDANGCEATASITIEVGTQPESLDLTCDASSTSELVFNWNALDGVNDYEVTVSNGITQTVSNNSFTVTGLLPAEAITLEVTPIYSGPCNVESEEITCITADCPAVSLEFIDPGPMCSDDSPIQLAFIQTGGSGAGFCQWQGPGLISSDGLFDPVLAGPGNHILDLLCMEGPCEYSLSVVLTVFPTPIAAFNLENEICVNEFGTITFQGQAGPSASYSWDFDGGTAVPGIGAGPHEVTWPSSGLKTVSLSIEENSCPSQTFSRDIEVETDLPTPNVSCIGINDQLAFGWQPVPGATGYEVNVLSGQTGVLNNTIFIVSNLQPGEEVELEVVAINGGGVCDDSVDTLSCMVETDIFLLQAEPIFQMDETSGTINLGSIEAIERIRIKGPFPNPTTSQTIIELYLPTLQEVELTIIDINGRTVEILSRSKLEGGMHQFDINAAQYVPGIYLLNLKVGDNVFTKKLAVIN